MFFQVITVRHWTPLQRAASTLIGSSRMHLHQTKHTATDFASTAHPDSTPLTMSKEFFHLSASRFLAIVRILIAGARMYKRSKKNLEASLALTTLF